MRPWKTLQPARQWLSSLRGKLLGCFVGLMTVVAVAVAVSYHKSNHANRERFAAQLVAQVSSAITNAANNYAEEAALAVAALQAQAQAAPATLDDVEALRRYLLSFTQRSSLAKYVYVASADGRFVGVERTAANPSDPVFRTRLANDTHLVSQPVDAEGSPSGPATASATPYNPTLRPWYQRAVSAEAGVWTEPYYSASKNILVVTYASPIYDRRGVRVAVVGIDFNLDQLVQRMASLQPSARSAVHLFSAEGKHLAGSAGLPPSAAESARIKAWFDTDRSSQTRFELVDEGDTFYAMRRSESDLNLTTFVRIPSSELIPEAGKSFLWAALAALIALAIALYLGLRTVRSVIADLSALSASANEIVRGTAMTALPISRQDEVGELARAFHAMRTRILQDLTAARVGQGSDGFTTLQLTTLPVTVGAGTPAARTLDAQTLAHALNSSADAFAILDSKGDILYANRAFAFVFRFDYSRLAPMNVAQCFSTATDHDHDHDGALALIAQVLKIGSPLRKTVQIHHKPGARRFVEVVLAPIRNELGEIGDVTMSARDVTNVVRKRNALYLAAQHDPATGLMRRDAMLAVLRARTTMSDSTPFWLAFIDLDGFKAINDENGHGMGDRLLAALGQVIKSRMRDIDIACRFGGDEFALLIEDGSEDHARTIAKRLISEMEATARRVVGPACRLSASVGLARFPIHGDDSDALVAAADLAMYAAKRTGGGREHVADTPVSPASTSELAYVAEAP
jgi:diguanylate cyclase (GGDEF)-like protein/PAS domain S-box-containing protein